MEKLLEDYKSHLSIVRAKHKRRITAEFKRLLKEIAPPETGITATSQNSNPQVAQNHGPDTSETSPESAKTGGTGGANEPTALDPPEAGAGRTKKKGKKGKKGKNGKKDGNPHGEGGPALLDPRAHEVDLVPHIESVAGLAFALDLSLAGLWLGFFHWTGGLRRGCLVGRVHFNLARDVRIYI